MEPEKKLILFGGKGGVGKTTVSSAIAARLAASGIRTLHITSDKPACLSFLYGKTIGDQISNVADNLDALEISSTSISKRWHEKFGNDFRKILSHFLDMEAIDRDSQLPLMNYVAAAPAFRSEALIDLIIEMAQGEQYDKIICDTAPAVETLNLFSLPDIIKTHLKSAAKMYEAFDFLGGRLSGNKPIADIVGQWGDWSKKTAEFLRKRACFVIVATPEALVVKRTQEIIESLREYKMPLKGVVVNRIAKDDKSTFSTLLAAKQEKHIKKLFQFAGEKSAALLPIFTEEIIGIEILEKMGTMVDDQLMVSKTC